MLACTTDQYDELYAPWLENPDTLLWLGKYQPGDCLLDLCGGTGAIAKAALQQGGQSIYLLDLVPRCTDSRVFQTCGPAEHVDALFLRDFDLIVCRQALGYLDPAKVFPAVAKILKPQGRFVFNSFCRPRRISVKRYLHGSAESARYLEAHLFLFGWVLHLQVRFRAGADLTLFRHHDRDELLELLKPWFQVEIKPKGRSLRWVCVRR